MSCGLCCMGALHDFVYLQPDEVRCAADLGLPLRSSGPPSFSLPCPQLANRKCGIFPKRPRVCGAYRCQLLMDKEAGSIDLTSALQIVAQAHALFRSVEETVIEGTVPEARERAMNPEMGADGEVPQGAREQRMRERLSVMALDVFLDRHFRSDRDGRMYVAAD